MQYLYMLLNLPTCDCKGLPNTFGEYDETPEVTARYLSVSIRLVVI